MLKAILEVMKLNNNLKILSIAIVAIVLIGGGFYLTRDKSQNEPVTIAKEEQVTIRLLTSSTTIYPWDVVKKINERNILNEEDIKIEYITSLPSTGGTTSLQALLANNIDYDNGASLAAWINVIASGGKIKAVHGRQVIKSKEHPGYYWVVLENSTVYNANDFVGKKLSVNVLGAEADFATRTYLKNNGIPIDSVQLVVVPSEQAEQVLRTKQVDIAFIGERPYEAAKARGRIRVVTTSYDIRGKGQMSAGKGFREDFIKEHPDAVKRFVLATEKSNRLIWDEFQKNPASVRKAVAEILKEQGGKTDEADYYIPEFVPDNPFLTDEDVQWWIDRLVEVGKLKEGQIKPSDIYTNEFNTYYKK